MFPHPAVSAGTQRDNTPEAVERFSRVVKESFCIHRSISVKNIPGIYLFRYILQILCFAVGKDHIRIGFKCL